MHNENIERHTLENVGGSQVNQGTRHPFFHFFERLDRRISHRLMRQLFDVNEIHIKNQAAKTETFIHYALREILKIHEYIFIRVRT